MSSPRLPTTRSAIKVSTPPIRLSHRSSNVKKRKIEGPGPSTKKVKVTTRTSSNLAIEDTASFTESQEPKGRQDVDGKQPIVVSESTTLKKTGSGKRTAKEQKDGEKTPLATRSIGSKIHVGAHVSAAGGVQKAVLNSLHIGGNAFALFLKSQRKWANPPLKNEDAATFRSYCKSHSYHVERDVVPHGSYLVNLAHTDAERTAQAYAAFLDDLKRCHQLGIQLYNFHPGNCASSTREDAIRHLAQQLNNAHRDPSTGTVITLLETMASAGNTIGGTFAELASIIELIDDKSRIGICLDTCHVFAAGYDLRSPTSFAAVIDQFNTEIGLKYLRALHVNDSKAPIGSHKDLHANIGTGFLGLRAFHNLVNEPRLWGLPLVLETPASIKNDKGKDVEDPGIYAKEIKLLESLVGMDIESSEFELLEKDLRAKGEKERIRIQDQLDRKTERDTKKANRATKGAGKSIKGKSTRKANASSEESSEEAA